MRTKSIYVFIVVAVLTVLTGSCGGGKKSDSPEETSTTGNIVIAVDESLRPVMEQQMKVWDSSNPNGHINVEYLPESDCFQQLEQGKVKLVVTARDATEAEKAAMGQAKLYVQSMPVAGDGIAIIINPAAADSQMTMGMLMDILQNKFPRQYKVAVDNPRSSIVRYIADTLLKTDSIPNAFSLKNSQAVIDYVIQNKDALGLVGVTHVYDPEDVSGIGRFLNTVKVVQLRDDSTYKFHQPYQYALALREYPLRRSIWMVTTDANRSGLAMGFINFLSGEQGQLLFKKSRMVPLKVPLQIREVHVTR